MTNIFRRCTISTCGARAARQLTLGAHAHSEGYSSCRVCMYRIFSNRTRPRLEPGDLSGQVVNRTRAPFRARGPGMA